MEDPDKIYLLPKPDMRRRPKALAKRSNAATEHDLYLIARLYVRGKPVREIAQALTQHYKDEGQDITVTYNMVYDQITEIHKRWVNSSLIDFDQAKGRELEHWNHLEATFWEMYERSLQAKTTKDVQKIEDEIAFAYDQVVPITRTKRRRKVEERDGSTAALEGVAMCIRERCKILGLYSPEKIQVDWRVEAQKAGLPAQAATQLFDELVGKYVEEMERNAEGGQEEDEPEDTEP